MSHDVWATALGTSPIATASCVSLLVTLLLLTAVRLSLYVGPFILQTLQSIPFYTKWDHKITKQRRGLTMICFCVVAVTATVVTLSALMEGFAEETDLAAWDRAFVMAAHHNLSPPEVLFFKFITELAGRAASYILGFGLGLYFLYRKNWRLVTIWAGGLIGNAIIIQTMKQYYQRPRPDFMNPFLTEQNFSFPSGHAAGSVVMFGLLGYFLLTHFSQWPMPRKLLVVTLVLWMGVFIGASRLALGVHYPTDVGTGWLVASSWLVILITIDRLVWRKHRIQDTDSLD